MTGIRAVADIMVPAGGNSFAMYTLTSPGCWGVESDCGDKYRAEIYGVELSALKSHIKAIGQASLKLTD